jgi:hypothetical protein
MKMLTYIVISVTLIVIGFFINHEFFEFSFSLLHTEGITFVNRINAGQSNSSWLLPIFLGTIPWFYALVKKITDIEFFYKGLLTASIIVGLGILFWRLRIFGLNAQFDELSIYNLPKGLNQQLDISILKFEVYLFMGFIVGMLISILIFRDRTKSLLN